MGLLKRLESSVHSLSLTVAKILGKVEAAIARIDEFEARDDVGLSINSFSELSEIDMDDQELEDVVGGKVRVFLADVDRVRWRQDLDRGPGHPARGPRRGFGCRRRAAMRSSPSSRRLLVEKAKNPTNGDNRKALIFTAYSDTAEYLYANVAEWAVADLGLHVALITGGSTKTTAPLMRSGMHEVLPSFSPRAKSGDLDGPQIDVVIATDTISEGQNLQDCDTVVNYDIHWNPVRIVQRFGRVDRLGTTNATVHLVNFWPNIDLESYINLEKRVSSRMSLLDVSATGEENVLDSGDAAAMNDLEYRRRQLEQMRVAAPTMEDLAGGLSITDLTLSDFRMDAAARPATELAEIEHWPLALFAVSRFDSALADDGLAPGAIFLLRAREGTSAVPADYPLAPHLLVYVTDDGVIAHGIEQPKLALDVLRHHALGQTEPDADALAAFNTATRKGRDVSALPRAARRCCASSQRQGQGERRRLPLLRGRINVRRRGPGKRAGHRRPRRVDGAGAVSVSGAPTLEPQVVLGLPASVHQPGRLPKKTLVEQAASQTADSALITRAVSGASVEAVLRADNLKVPSYVDEQRRVDDIAVFHVALSDAASPADMTQACRAAPSQHAPPLDPLPQFAS